MHLQLNRDKLSSYWIPGAYAPTVSKKRHSFLTLLKNKGLKEERMTKVGLLRHRQLHVPGIQQEPRGDTVGLQGAT